MSENDEKIKLEWGVTPWHNLSKDELLKEVLRMVSALQSANSVISQARDAAFFHRVNAKEYDFEEYKNQIDKMAAEDGYWGKGTGARSYEKVNQALSRLEFYESESLYRSFFRYADDLIFGRKFGWGWAVCPKCGMMVGDTSSGQSAIGEVCTWGKDCDGIFRELRWSDLEPKKD